MSTKQSYFGGSVEPSGLVMFRNKQGMYGQGYADNFIIVIRGKHLGACLDVMRTTLTSGENGVRREVFRSSSKNSHGAVYQT